MKKGIIVLLFILSNIAGVIYSQELVGTKITIKDAWDNVFRSVDQGRNYELIGTYQGWNKNAIYIAGYNNQNVPSYYSTKYVSFGGAGVERLWVDLLSGNVGIGTTNPENKLSIEDGSSSHVGLSISNNIYGSNQGNFFFFKTGDSYIVTDQKNAGVIESYNDLILSAASGTGVTAPAIKFQTGRNGYIGNTRMLIDNSGNVGIGTQNPSYKLDVLGTIRAKEVLVNLDGGADFVFEKDYKLPTIEHVATYVQENKHLPGVPSANEMVKNGVSMGDMQVKLLQKVEELTLYAIQQNKQIDKQSKRIENQETDRKTLEAKLAKQENQYNALLEKVEMLTKQIENK